MVEPSDSLQAVFEKAISTAKQMHHEYLTIEHLLFATLLDESFVNCVQGYGADANKLKDNVLTFLKEKCDEITTQEVVVKPKKTQSVERVLNRAFTQVLFNGRQQIEPTDVFLSMMGEKRSWAFFYIQQADIDKDKFADYLSNSAEEEEDDTENQSDNQSIKALRAYTTNLKVKSILLSVELTNSKISHLHSDDVAKIMLS